MLKFFQGLSKLLANYTSIFVIGVAVFTFFFPHTFDWVRGTTHAPSLSSCRVWLTPWCMCGILIQPWRSESCWWDAVRAEYQATS